MTESADVVVVGGGIVGCAAAYELAAAGAGRVLLLERADGVGLGSTGACAGGFRQQFTTEVNVRLSQASVPMILGFTERHGQPVDVSQDGYLFLVRDEASWEGFLRAVELQRSLGVEVAVLTPPEAAALVPGIAVGDLVGATFGPRDGIADPGALTQGYATVARRAGAELRLGVSVERLRTSGDRVTGVVTSSDEIAAGAVVLATGAWTAALAATAGLSVPIDPVPRVVVTTSAFPGVPARRTLVIDVATSFYFHREADGILMGMAGDDVVGFDLAVDPAFVSERLVPRALEVFPPLEAAGIRSAWAGLYEMTPDRHPIVGETPLERLFIGAGFSGHGFQHGPIVGRLLAELLTEGHTRSVDVSALAYERFTRGDLVREGHVV
jgi:sarcosine oxidase subunit beta